MHLGSSDRDHTERVAGDRFHNAGRQDDMVRGHGNQPPWKAAGRLPSTELGLQSLTLTELFADMRHWRARKAGCLAPCALPPPSHAARR